MKKRPTRKITALIPCYNEESGIVAVINKFPHERLRAHGYELEVVVINNNSIDRTAEVAEAAGARVIHESKKGKGNAIRAGFQSIGADTDYVVMLDGDDTYRADEVLRLVEILDSGFGTVAIGSRMVGRISHGSMPAFNRLGNWGFSLLVRLFYQVNVTDVLTGYFAWKREAIERLHPHLTSDGFAIEMEMITKMARIGEQIYCVPINYEQRAGESSLNPIKDGLRILWMFTKNLVWTPPVPKETTRRFAFVTDVAMPWHKGGKERRLYEITKRLASAGHECHVYTMHWWKEPEPHIIREGVHYHAISRLYPLYTREGKRSITQGIRFSLAIFKLLFEDFDVLDVDHMPQFSLFTARIVAWMQGKKLHATWHEVWGREYWREYLGTFKGELGYFTEWLSFKMPDIIISNSDHTTVRLRSVGFRRRVETIPLGADVESIRSTKPSTMTTDVVYVGRLMAHKNVDKLIRGIALVREHHPGIKALIIGSGPERARLHALIIELGLENHVTILDEIEDHAELYSLLKASKMLVLPSVREGFGLVVVEANAAGLPVITTPHPDNAAKDLIREGENGLLAEPSPEDIARAILQVLKDRKKMRPHVDIDQYDWSRVAQNAEDSYITQSV